MQNAYPKTWIQKRAHPGGREHLPLGIAAVGSYLLNRHWKEHQPPRWFAQLFWVFEGEGAFAVGDREVTVGRDDIFVYAPGTEHRIRSTSNQWGYCWVVFDHADCVQWFRGFGFGEGRYPSGPCPRDRFSSIRRALRDGSIEGEYEAAHLGHALLLEASRQRPPVHSLMTRAKQRMDDRYTDPDLTVQSLADELEIHRTTLFRLFREQYGLTPNDYLKNLRLHQALHMVQQGDDTIQNIARLSGYSDPNYLTRLVKQHLGRSARDMRRARRRDRT